MDAPDRPGGRQVSFKIARQATIATDPGELGKTSKPLASWRFTISSFHVPVRQTTSAILLPA
jgi:hypothetical protein